MRSDTDELDADLVVVGFGAAGACAAIEAADAGAAVLVLDRFGGGGTSAVSGGVVYAGGGTAIQHGAGVRDSPEAMYQYLRMEVGDAVSSATLRRFCAESSGMMDWLSGLGVPFASSLCPDKTSYPSNRHYLYYSGSERSEPFASAAEPAPRGHRAHGRGTSGATLFTALARAVRARGVAVYRQTTVTSLTRDEAGRVTGVLARTLRDAPGWARLAHRLLSRYAAKPGLYVPALGRALRRRAARLDQRFGRALRVRARSGVVLAAGGFVANREMMRQHAPAYRGCLPLGTPGDDGGGLWLGIRAGGATAKLDRLSAWRFVTPPTALVEGLLVDRAGQRICDESRYGAAIGAAILERTDAAAWLLIDRRIRAAALRQLRGPMLWFQRLQGWYLLRAGAHTAWSLDELAERVGIEADGLRETVRGYHRALADGEPDPAGKRGATPLDSPPYTLLDVSIRPNPGYPCPVLTLGGLVVNERTGAVRAEDGTDIPGLYAAGRVAVGLCANSYVSGLSLADCVFSGRRAGVAAIAAARGVDTNKNMF
ncbi:3-oxo-5alpha-steroid 4-dehydrogenase [Tamaricihabitans halophyticus]|uniref:3-oxo-5alpha-steroid 4-dehydrogenase n=1 Tax=Tamaricihabitans halophyticus TaxID=1262583 RepID=A0A4R2QE95_9PSEU|nr:FAD-binding protein [Tamaricihabitans halophyticus]TCP45361.1 3-oxo-5alpha-steroid 4-dehydrogenase [Tamaricihabitans halophyticus]